MYQRKGFRKRKSLLALLSAIAFVGLPGNALAQAAPAPAPAPTRTLWWNDPVIVGEIGLRDEQRSKMDAAFDGYQQKLASGPKMQDNQRKFLEALEAGQWDLAQKIVGEWFASGSSPQQAMAELKLKVLPVLDADQRTKLLASYPRVIRRQWRPAVGWARKPAGRPTPKQPAKP
jgi:Spy/CpxP family protein refolding chaperone